jgi:uncharacterized protein YpmB
MKKKIKSLTLTLGVIIAAASLTYNSAHAAKTELESKTETIRVKPETLHEVEEMLEMEPLETPCTQRIQIFNGEKELIYECRGKDDKRLTMLLRRSDLIFQTESSSYYLLGD